jgi:hypothetical protein
MFYFFFVTSVFLLFFELFLYTRASVCWHNKKESNTRVMLRTKPRGKQPRHDVHNEASSRDDDDDATVNNAMIKRPPLTRQLLQDVFEGDIDMTIIPYSLANRCDPSETGDEYIAIQPRDFQFMNTCGQMIGTQPSIASYMAMTNAQRSSDREWKRARMNTALTCDTLWDRHVREWQPRDTALCSTFHTGDESHHHDDDVADESHDAVHVRDQRGFEGGRPPSLGETMARLDPRRPPPTIVPEKVIDATFHGDTGKNGINVSLRSYDAFACQRSLKSHKERLNPVTEQMLHQMNERVRRIETEMNKPSCHYYAGPLEHVETNERVTKMSWPFVHGDEMEETDKELLRTLIPKKFTNAHKPPFILWGAAGDPIMELLAPLPFVQMAPVKDKASVGKDRGFRQDLGYSIGTVSLYRMERKDWTDCMESYTSRHYQAQRATMSRSGLPSCCMDFIVEFPKCLLDGSLTSSNGPNNTLDMFMKDYAMHRAIEATTLHEYGIHTRRTLHLFDTVNHILDDIHKILEHGAAKFSKRMDGHSTCFTPDTTTTASAVLSNVGRKSDLDQRHQFVMAFNSSLMQMSERSLHALFEQYGSVSNLIQAYLKCPESQRDDMLTREVQFKDAHKYSIFGVKDDEDDDVSSANAQIAGKKKAPKPKAPFGPATSARIHRFLFSLPPLEPKTTKGRAKRKRVGQDNADDDDE